MRRLDRIVALLDAALAGGLGSAAAVSVGDAGVEVFRYWAGHTRKVPTLGAPIDAHTMFDLASVTKVMCTAELAMQLAEAGKLDVDAPVRRYLPDAATEGTVRQLLDHRAGCPAHVEFFRALRGARPADPYAELVARATREPCATPGGERLYSDLGFLMLGAIVEQVGELPLSAAGRFAPPLVDNAVATELDERGLVCGLVHDENAFYANRACGHAGLFGSLDDVARFAASCVNDHPHRREWLGWDTPSPTPGVSQAGDRWPREHAIGHTGFTGTALWFDLPRRRWCALLTNRVHPTRHANTADAIKSLRRAVNDAVVDALGG